MDGLGGGEMGKKKGEKKKGGVAGEKRTEVKRTAVEGKGSSWAWRSTEEKEMRRKGREKEGGGMSAMEIEKGRNQKGGR